MDAGRTDRLAAAAAKAAIEVEGERIVGRGEIAALEGSH
jgi:hypothetical protein